MKYEPFSELIKPYSEGPFSAMPAELRQRSVDVYSLWGAWDDLTPEIRRSVAKQHDSQFDPARKDERNLIRQLTHEIDQCLKNIDWWNKMHPQSITEAGEKKAKLAALTVEIATLQQRLLAPFNAVPEPGNEPDQSTTVNETAPPDIGVYASRPSSPAWSIKRPTRFQGYGKPLYDFLKAAHTAGQPRPNARNFLDSLKSIRPPDVVEVSDNGLKYYDALGNTKPADLEAIRKAIGRMTQ